MQESSIPILNPDLFSSKSSVGLGLDHLHVGWYKQEEDHLEHAALNIIKRMDRLIPKIKKSSRILILGSRYGSVARYFVDQYDCKVDCIHQDAQQMAVSQEINRNADIEEKINTVHAHIGKIPFPRETFDVVWSQDQLFLIKEKMSLFREVYRVLKPEGRFIFTDIMQSDIKEDFPEVNIAVEDFFSEEAYRRMASRVDLEPVFKRMLTDSFQHHLSKVEDRDDTFSSASDWKMLNKGNLLEWGILQFQKRND